MSVAIHYVTGRGPLCQVGRVWRYSECLNDVSCERCFARICRVLEGSDKVFPAPPAT